MRAPNYAFSLEVGAVIPPLLLIGVILTCGAAVVVALVWFLRWQRTSHQTRRSFRAIDSLEPMWSDLDSLVSDGREVRNALEDLGAALATQSHEDNRVASTAERVR